MAKKVEMYKTSDGQVFESHKHAYNHEAELITNEKLKELVEKTVPYTDNQDMVLDFLLEQKSNIYHILQQEDEKTFK